jgi:phage-related holin
VVYLERFNAIIHFFNRLIEYPAVKLICGFFIGLIRLLWGTTLRPAYLGVFILWCFDTATGYYHARANPNIKPVSGRMWNGLAKLLVYYGLMLIVYQIARCSYEGAVMIQTAVEFAICVTEGKSCLENIKLIGVLKKWPDGVMGLIDKLLKLFEGKFNEALDRKENDCDDQTVI